MCWGISCGVLCCIVLFCTVLYCTVLYYQQQAIHLFVCLSELQQSVKREKYKRAAVATFCAAFLCFPLFFFASAATASPAHSGGNAYPGCSLSLLPTAAVSLLGAAVTAAPLAAATLPYSTLLC